MLLPSLELMRSEEARALAVFFNSSFADWQAARKVKMKIVISFFVMGVIDLLCAGDLCGRPF